jgi:hypothetical protein
MPVRQKMDGITNAYYNDAELKKLYSEMEDCYFCDSQIPMLFGFAIRITKM